METVSPSLTVTLVAPVRSAVCSRSLSEKRSEPEAVRTSVPVSLEEEPEVVVPVPAELESDAADWEDVLLSDALVSATDSVVPLFPEAASPSELSASAVSADSAASMEAAASATTAVTVSVEALPADVSI